MLFIISRYLLATGFRGKNIAGVLTAARLKTSRRVLACDIFSQKSMLIMIDLRRNCKHENADTNNFDEIHFAEFLASLLYFNKKNVLFLKTRASLYIIFISFDNISLAEAVGAWCSPGCNDRFCV